MNVSGERYETEIINGDTMKWASWANLPNRVYQDLSLSRGGGPKRQMSLQGVRSEPNVGVPVTSGKPADAGRLGTSIPKLKPVSAFFTQGGKEPN